MTKTTATKKAILMMVTNAGRTTVEPFNPDFLGLVKALAARYRDERGLKVSLKWGTVEASYEFNDHEDVAERVAS